MRGHRILHMQNVMSFRKKSLTLLLLCAATLLCHVANALPVANKFTNDASYQVCFTPGDDCTQLIVNLLGQAKKSIYVQAYSFTSMPIANAIVKAHKRNIDVRVILDKSQRTQKYSSSHYLTNSSVPTWVDYKPAIAHNKIIIVDNRVIVTGSFNFTKAAQYKNAENVIVIQDSKLAHLYLSNFHDRQRKSEKI